MEWDCGSGIGEENKTHMMRHFSLIRQVLQLAPADPEREPGTAAAHAASSETAGPRIQSGAADSARWSGIVGLDLENKTHMIRHFSLIRQVLQLALADPERETRDSSSRRSRQ